MAYKILFMGASYGSLFASKLIPGGHKMHFICLPAEAGSSLEPTDARNISRGVYPRVKQRARSR